jgi:REP element-mobilizing transposase RayT
MAHTYSNLVIHALFSTRDRIPALKAEWKAELFSYQAGIITRLGGWPILINGPKDHVHLLFGVPPRLALADLLEKVKSNSSKWLHAARPGCSNFAWQTGYAAFSVSHSNIASVKEYIANQEAHHRNVTFQEEVLAFLKRHEIEYDPRYVWG